MDPKIFPVQDNLTLHSVHLICLSTIVIYIFTYQYTKLKQGMFTTVTEMWFLKWIELLV